MSTRSLIGLEEEKTDRIESIYCHWDGYPAGVGAMLIARYSTRERVQALLTLGDLISLGPEIGEKHDTNWRQVAGMSIRESGARWNSDPRSTWCQAFRRDRDETGTQALNSVNLTAFQARGERMWADYLYLMDKGGWRAWAGATSVLGACRISWNQVTFGASADSKRGLTARKVIQAIY